MFRQNCVKIGEKNEKGREIKVGQSLFEIELLIYTMDVWVDHRYGTIISKYIVSLIHANNVRIC